MPTIENVFCRWWYLGRAVAIQRRMFFYSPGKSLLYKVSYCFLGSEDIQPELYQNIIDKKSKWLDAFPCFRGAFNDTLIVVTFNFPFYDNIKVLNKLYVNVFGKVVHCGGRSQNGGQEPDLIVDLSSGHRGYICMALAIEKYPGFKGECHVSLERITNALSPKNFWQVNLERYFHRITRNFSLTTTKNDPSFRYKTQQDDRIQANLRLPVSVNWVFTHSNTCQRFYKPRIWTQCAQPTMASKIRITEHCSFL